MSIRIKNWKKFQHFRDRRPPWIKLYRDILDDIAWHELAPESAKALVMLWLIASENDGCLPDTKTLAFRLRTTEAKVRAIIGTLGHYIEGNDISSDITDDDSVISDRYQGDPPETERETEKISSSSKNHFDQFWARYPKKVGKGDAAKKFRQALGKVDFDTLMAGLDRYCRSDTVQRGFIANPATWLHQERWTDELQTALTEYPGYTPLGVGG